MKRRFKPSKKPKDPLSPWVSAWFVTIDPHQTDPGIITPLEITWQYILEHITAFTYGRGYITRVVETLRTFEQGDKYHRIHMHTKVEISTNGIAYLDFVKITQFINRQLRQIPSFKGVYFNATLIENYNHSVQLKQYVEKAPFLPRTLTYPGFQII